MDYDTPETKQQKKQLTGRGEPAQKKAKSVPSAGKVVALVFWVMKGILCIDYLGKAKTITVEYYACPLDRLKTVIAKQRTEIAKKKVLFDHKNAPPSGPCPVKNQRIRSPFTVPGTLNFEEIMSKNKVQYKTQIAVLHIELSYLSNHPR